MSQIIIKPDVACENALIEVSGRGESHRVVVALHLSQVRQLADAINANQNLIIRELIFAENTPFLVAVMPRPDSGTQFTISTETDQGDLVARSGYRVGTASVAIDNSDPQPTGPPPQDGSWPRR